MYNPYYQQPYVQPQVYPQPITPQIPAQPTTPVKPQLPQFESSYIENILRLNRGKLANVYMNYEGSQWGSKIYRGFIEEAGRDHIVLRDAQSEMRYLLPSIYLSYVTFDEKINYEYPFSGGSIFNQIQQLKPQQQTQQFEEEA